VCHLRQPGRGDAAVQPVRGDGSGAGGGYLPGVRDAKGHEKRRGKRRMNGQKVADFYNSLPPRVRMPNGDAVLVCDDCKKKFAGLVVLPHKRICLECYRKEKGITLND
jgi:hypothetical protein